jgi:mono/diheme cytochrome c family protein
MDIRISDPVLYLVLFTTMLLSAACVNRLVRDTTSVTAENPPPGYTREQALSGAVIYRQRCVECHGTNLANGPFGAPLKGNYFQGRWRGKSAAALYVLTLNTMPPDQPMSLADTECADLVAYILQANGIEAGPRKLPSSLEALGSMILQWE